MRKAPRIGTFGSVHKSIARVDVFEDHRSFAQGVGGGDLEVGGCAGTVPAEDGHSDVAQRSATQLVDLFFDGPEHCAFGGDDVTGGCPRGERASPARGSFGGDGCRRSASTADLA